MKLTAKCLLASLLGCTFLCLAASLPAAEEAARDHRLELAEGELKLMAQGTWQIKKPENRIIEHELSVPPTGDDKEAGRVTIMGAGGTMDANVERWIGQFKQPDGSDTHQVTKQKDIKVGGLEVRVVDISGTYNDTRGPFSGIPAVERPKYRMLAAIITSKKVGNYFVKFYGPQQTVSESEGAFMKMIDTLEVK